jgi:hypothetical protein
MKYPWAVPGKKVKCTAAFEGQRKGVEAYPIQGETYTIRGIRANHRNHVFITLVEITNPLVPTKDVEPHFHIEGFKPLTDISIFQKMLTTKVREQELT